MGYWRILTLGGLERMRQRGLVWLWAAWVGMLFPLFSSLYPGREAQGQQGTVIQGPVDQMPVGQGRVSQGSVGQGSGARDEASLAKALARFQERFTREIWPLFIEENG